MEHLDLATTTRPKARKEHKCCECGDPIPKGAVHACTTGLWEGKWYTSRMCQICDEVLKEYVKTIDDPHEDYPAFGELHSAIRGAFWSSELEGWLEALAQRRSDVEAI